MSSNLCHTNAQKSCNMSKPVKLVFCILTTILFNSSCQICPLTRPKRLDSLRSVFKVLPNREHGALDVLRCCKHPIGQVTPVEQLKNNLNGVAFRAIGWPASYRSVLKTHQVFRTSQPALSRLTHP